MPIAASEALSREGKDRRRSSARSLTVTVEQCLNTFDAGDVGRKLRPQVAVALIGRAGVQQDDLEDIAVDLAGVKDTHRRNAEVASWKMERHTAASLPGTIPPTSA